MTRRRKPQQTNIPDYELEALARCLFPDMQAYFESEEGKREFAAWQEQREKEKRIKGSKP